MIEELEFVASTVAVVYAPHFQPKSPVSGQALSQFLNRPTANTAPDGSLVITSHRDQLEVLLTGPKVDVRDVSGTYENTHERIPSVVRGICRLVTDDSPISFGINFVILVPKQNPRGWIADRFLDRNLASTIDTPVESAGISLTYDQLGKRITVRFEPTPESSVMVNFNASEEITTLPEQERLATDIKALRASLLQFLDTLDI